MNKILLHICCGVCAAGAVERLCKEDYEVVGFFYNPNIHPVEEYNRRLEVAKKVANNLKFKIIEAEYDKDNWFKQIKGLGNEPEGGRRCDICFKIRLEKTFEYFKGKEFDYFTTTLTISPHKNKEIINKIGEEIGGRNFLSRDFKRKEGFKKAIQIAKNLNLYRQNYCGCSYSKRLGKVN